MESSEVSDDNYSYRVSADSSDDTSSDKHCYHVENDRKRADDNLHASIKKVDTVVNLKIQNRSIKMKIDTVSDVNIIDQPSFEKLKDSLILKKTNIDLRGYNSTVPLKVLGKFCEVIESK